MRHLIYCISYSLTLLVGAHILADNSERSKTMIDEIANMTHYSQEYTGIDAIDKSVMEVLGAIDRSEFVPEELASYAFENRPLGIGHGQTISQPFIVALMTHVLKIQPQDRVLEIGTGSGYQAAVLARLASEVFTIEIVEALAKEADDRLTELGYENVNVRIGDGWFGWPEEQPFDKIMVTAVAPKAPPQLLAQLKPGGRLAVPVGEYDGFQELKLFQKAEDGSVSERVVLPVRFVPMTGAAESH